MTKSWTDINTAIADYVHDYEMIGESDEGESSYYPNELERYMLIDAIHGLLADSEFCDTLRDVLSSDNRLREFATLAGLYSKTTVIASAQPLDTMLKSFAELIVRDVVNTISMGIDRSGRDTPEYKRSMKHIADIHKRYNITY